MLSLFLLGATWAFRLQAENTAALLSQEAMTENPIRRIVNLLQKMQNDAETEAARDADLNAKFECYCHTNDGELSASTADLRAQIPLIEKDIESAVSLKAQLDAELVAHKDDREQAKATIASATKQREKEAASFAEESSELKSNIGACASAVQALTAGMTGSFLQSDSAGALRQLVLKRSFDRYSQSVLTEFLSTNSQYAPVSGEVVGIVSQLKEDMQTELKDITKTENTSVAQFEGLVAAKEKEIEAATAAIESKTERAGETAVKCVSLKNDLEDTKDSLGEDERFLMELKKNCASKGSEFEERKKIRADELVAISEVIKILNDDDALDLFKKTLASPSLLQVSARYRDVQQRALAALNGQPQLNLISMALRGKKAGFEKVLKMVDEMIETLGREQVDDDSHKDWCNTEFDQKDDEEKATVRRIDSLAAQIAESEESISELANEISALKTGLKNLDIAVEEATAQRREENKVFVQTQAQNNAALQLLQIAKNRLNKFYNPALYKPPPQRELTEEERIYQASGGVLETPAPPTGIAGTGVTVFAQLQMRDAPAPPPETGDYTKKDSSGPLALIDSIVRDLEKDMQESENDEQSSQKDYEEFMANSAAKRTTDSAAITEKESQKASLEADHMSATDSKKGKEKELLATREYIQQLHGSCDFLLSNFDMRRDARANEVEALKRAKAVLNGADYSLLQEKSEFLSRKH